MLTTIRDMHDELLECVNGEDAGNTNGDAVAEEIIQMAEELLLQDHVPPLLWYPLALAYWYLNMPT
ncbi:MAG TPA: hypothetical protein PK765_00680 [bacterium]|nr:hypothetical protein [bacterium]